MATLSSIFAWKIPWTEEPGGLIGHHLSNTHTHTHTHDIKTIFCIGNKSKNKQMGPN